MRGHTSRSCGEHDWGDAHRANAAVDVDHDDLTFGCRFIAEELSAAGYVESENRVARICHDHRIFSAHSKKLGLSRKPGPPAHDDLVNRYFTAESRNVLWLTIFTEHPTAEGRPYVCAVNDSCSNRIVGYSMGDRMTAPLAVRALRHAIVMTRWQTRSSQPSKRELVHRYRFHTRAEARRTIFTWINRYNHRRQHSTLGCQPPAQWEQQHYYQQANQAA